MNPCAPSSGRMRTSASALNSRFARCGEEAARLGGHPEGAPVLLGGEGWARDVHRHHHVRPEGAGLVHGQVVDHAAVDEEAPFPLHGGEGQGDGHARARRAREVAARDHDPLPVVEGGGHGAEGARQGVEVAPVRVARGGESLDQEPVHPVLGEQARGEVQVPEVEADSEDRAVLVLAPQHRHQATVRQPAEDGVPVERLHDVLELFRRPAGGVDRSDHRSHAGPRDRVHGDALFLEGLQHPHVGDAAGAPAREGDGETRPEGRRLLRDGGRRNRRDHHRGARESPVMERLSGSRRLLRP